MYFFNQKVKISLQVAKFPGNDIPKFPLFSSHGYVFIQSRTKYFLQDLVQDYNFSIQVCQLFLMEQKRRVILQCIPLIFKNLYVVKFRKFRNGPLFLTFSLICPEVFLKFESWQVCFTCSPHFTPGLTWSTTKNTGHNLQSGSRSV